MKSRKFIVCFLAVIQVFLFTSCSDDVKTIETVTEITSSAESEENTELYRTHTGECYHRDGCDYLRSKIATSAHEIMAKRLRPCSKCEPPCFE